MIDLGDLILGLKIDNRALKGIKGELASLEKMASGIKVGLDTRKVKESSSDVKSLKDEINSLSKVNKTLKQTNESLSGSYDKLKAQVNRSTVSQTKFKQSQKQTKEAISGSEVALEKTAKTLQLIQGPLGGLASRFVTFKSIVRDNTLGVAAFTVAAAGLSTVITGAFRSFIRTEANLVKFSNTLKSTGRDFETTLEDMDTAAENLARRTLLSLSEARDGLAQALTFTNIPTDQIERFGNVAADVAAGLNKDFKGTVTSIAKALQAPASALDGLGRAGQFFSKGQREVLQSLVDTGNSARATDLILSTLESRFKGIGTAEGISGALDSLEIDLELFRESIFQTSGAAEAITEVVNSLGKGLQSLTGEFSVASKIGGVIKNIAEGVSASFRLLAENVEQVSFALKGLGLSLIASKLFATGVAADGTKTKLLDLSKTVTLVSKAFKFLAGGAILLGLEALNNKVFGLEEGVSSFQNAFLTARAVFTVVVNRLKGSVEALKNSFVNLFNNVTKGFSDTFSGLVGGVDVNLTSILTNSARFGGDLINLFVKIFKSVGAAVSGSLGSIVNSLRQLFSGLITLGSSVGKLISGDFEAAGEAARSGLEAIGKNNPLSALSRGAAQAKEDIIAVFEGEEFIDTNKLVRDLENSSKSAGSVIGTVFEAIAGQDLTANIKSFSEEVLAIRNADIALIKERNLESSKGLASDVMKLSETGNKLKGIIDLAKQLSFGEGVNQAEALRGKIAGIEQSIKTITENQKTPEFLKLLERSSTDAKTVLQQLNMESARLNKELLEVERSDFVKAFNIGNGADNIEAITLKIERLKETLNEALSKNVIDINEIKIAEKAIKDLESQAFDLAHPVAAAFIEGMDQLETDAANHLAGKLLGMEQGSFKDIAKEYTKSLFSSLLQQLLLDPTAKLFKETLAEFLNPDTEQTKTQKVGNSLKSTTKSLFGAFGLGDGGAMTDAFGNLGNLFGGGISSALGGLGDIFQGFFANGGPVVGNKAAIVGEKGPELFLPKRAGQILNAGQVSNITNSAPDQRSVNINIQTQDADSFQLARGRIQSEAARLMRNS